MDTSTEDCGFAEENNGNMVLKVGNSFALIY